MRRIIHNNNGLTLVEMLVSLFVFIIILGAMIPTTISFYEKRSISSARDEVVGFLKRARSLAIGNQNQSAHGFIASSSSWIIFSGNSYSLRDSIHDEIFQKSQSIKAAGATEIVFSPLSGNATSSSGTTTLTLSIGEQIKTINFNLEGSVIW